MDASAAISSAVAGVNTGSAIAVSVLAQTEQAQATDIAILFSSVGLGAGVNTSA